MNWLQKLFKKKPDPPPVCQCGHGKCYHTGGWGACWRRFPELCNCAIYVEMQPPIETSEDIAKQLGVKL